MTNTQGTFLYLISCAFNSAQPDETALEGADFGALYRLAQKHSVAAIACSALENTRAFEAAQEDIKRNGAKQRIRRCAGACCLTLSARP